MNGRQWKLCRAALLASGCLLAAPGSAGGVYVAGEGFTLEQAAAQALQEQGETPYFWIVAAGDAARRLADGDAAELLARIRAEGGIVYACGRDLSPSQQARLPPGVELVPPADGSGNESGHDIAIEEEAAPVPESQRGHRLILRTCAALE